MSHHVFEAAELLSEAGTVRDLAARHAADADRTGSLSPAVVRAASEAGFARHFVPRRWGGSEGTFAALLDAVATVGEGCAATAWVASLTSSAARIAAFLPEEGQAELWDRGPDVLMSGALIPSGRARRVDGGWRVSGEWPYTSGVGFSDWALACAPAAAGQDSAPYFFAVPKSAYRIVGTWFNVGMRATGSDTLVLEDVFVPGHLAVPRSAVWDGVPSAAAPNLRVPMRSVNGLTFCGPVLGAAAGGLDAWSAWMSQKADISIATARGPAREKPSVQVALARTAGEIDAARLLLERAARLADTGSVSPGGVARSGRDCALAADLCVAAVDRIFRAGGTRGQSQDNQIQRVWRDVNAAASHVMLQFEVAGAAYSEQLFRTLAGNADADVNVNANGAGAAGAVAV
ncbi:acyl-CoA dehydrogenase family protein [Streptomyces sp. NPDC050636]|uniref:acyl-CoA dehydrogenase family protein n=1 Tax=Streptomyces sp. NPDC050636 TaxID=3154510 RepID=UPI00341962A7